MPLLLLPTRGTQLAGASLPSALQAAHVITIEPVPGPESAWDARVCAGIAFAQEANPEIGSEPLHIVAIGDAALLLPAVARANRSCHRHIGEYALLEPDVPATSDTWPDAPVTVFSDDPSITVIAGLRGWQVLDPSDLPGWLAELA